MDEEDDEEEGAEEGEGDGEDNGRDGTDSPEGDLIGIFCSLFFGILQRIWPILLAPQHRVPPIANQLCWNDAQFLRWQNPNQLNSAVVVAIMINQIHKCQ